MRGPRLAPLALALLLAGGAAAQEPPALTREQALEALKGPDAEGRRRAVARLAEVGVAGDAAALIQALRDPDATVRALANGSVWRVWSRSGNPEVDALFGLGIRQLGRGEAEAAIETFTRVIEKKPDFAEGWNKRATIYYIVGEYEKSLKDCDEVMKRNPDHFGALAGYGQIYLQLGEPERALQYFERALAVNPTMEQVELAIEQLRSLLIQKRKGTI